MSSAFQTSSTSGRYEQYQKEGIFKLPPLLSASQIDQLRQETDGIVERVKLQEYGVSFFWGGKWLSPEEESSAIVDRIFALETHSAVFAKTLFQLDPLFDFLTEVIGNNIQLLETNLVIKQPFNERPIRMHQDYPFFPHEMNSPVAIMIPLDDTTVNNGCLRVVKGSHTLGVLPYDATGHLMPGNYTLNDGEPVECEAGAAIVVNCLTVHGSGQNRTSNPRRAWVIKVRDPEDVPVKNPDGISPNWMLRGVNPLTG